MIFYSVEFSWSSISKSTIFPNFYHQFIVRFDQFEEIIKNFPNSLWIQPIFTIIPLNSRYFHKIGKFGIIYDTRPCAIDDLAVSFRQISCFLHLLDQFLRPMSIWKWDFVEKIWRNRFLNANDCPRIPRMKSLFISWKWALPFPS